MNINALLKVAPVIAGIRLYHRHSVVGKEFLPEKGPALIAVSHSLASYDIALLMAAVYEQINRIPRSLIDHLFFKVPGLGQIMEALGSLEGNRRNAIKLLNSGDLLVLAPGGMRESLRPSTEKYKIIWGKRRGFIRLSIETGAPIILAACPAADDLYDVAPSHITAWAYKTFKIPVFFARGLGLSPLPKPVTLTHYLSEPLFPPAQASDPEEFEKQVEEFHTKVCERMERLIQDGLKQDLELQKKHDESESKTVRTKTSRKPKS